MTDTQETSTSLETLLQLQDIRTRVLTRVPVSEDEYRALLLALREDREGAARTSKATARKVAAENRKVYKPEVQFDLATLFGGKK